MKKTLINIVEYVVVIALVILLRIFIVTPVEVDGESMEKTLYNKDIMILNIIGPKVSALERFDIVVIKYNDEYLIKRIIGLPGEKITYKDSKLYIDGVLKNDIKTDEITKDFSTDELNKSGIIPKGSYFVMGDNRDNSTDSRMIGFIKKENIVGKTSLVVFPFKHFGKVQ